MNRCQNWIIHTNFDSMTHTDLLKYNLTELHQLTTSSVELERWLTHYLKAGKKYRAKVLARSA